MEPTKLHNLIDQTGIETIFGVTPAQLPKLSEGAQQALRAGGLPSLQRQGLISVGATLLQNDPNLETTQQILSAPTAVVRVSKHGLKSGPAPRSVPGLFWAFVQGSHIVRLLVDTKQRGHYRLGSLPDSAALLGEIEKLLPISWMPQKAHARAVLDKGDAEDIFDQSLGSGLNVATELLVSDGLTDEQAQVAFDVMRTSALAGRISFMRVRTDEVVLTYGVTVGQDGGDIWMAYAAPSQSDGLVLETVLKGAFRHQLEAGWASLGLIKMERHDATFSE